MPRYPVHNLLHWLLVCIGRPPEAARRPDNLDVIDRRLSEVDHRLEHIQARLRLLERQADPREWQRRG